MTKLLAHGCQGTEFAQLVYWRSWMFAVCSNSRSTVEQVQKLLFVTEGHSMEALFKLALATGLRRGELMGLKWQDINFATGVLQVRRILSRIPTIMPGKGYVEAEPKTQKSRRSIVIASFALEALKQHRVRQLEAKLKAGAAWEDHDYVFCTSIGTHLNPTRDILDQLKALLQKAGLPDIRFHDLRHSAATLLLSVGVFVQGYPLLSCVANLA